MKAKEIIKKVYMGAFSCFFMIYGINLNAQHYAYQRTEGASEYWRVNGAYVKPIMEAPARQVLSDRQELPFTWSFYGKEVNSYYVSVNGYVTFDHDAINSYNNPSPIPNPDKPNNAIYVCWADWELKEGVRNPGRVYSWNQGIPPNRTHAIVWIGLSPANIEEETPSRTNLFLFIHEGGGFEILTRGNLDKPILSLVGAENADGSRATALSQMPSTDFPKRTFSARDDVSYRFEYSDQNLQARVITTNLGQIAKQGMTYQLSPTLWNTGSDTIRSFVINYQKDDGNVFKQSFDQIHIPYNEYYNFLLENTWLPDQPGRFVNWQFQVSEINGQPVKGQHFSQQVYINLGKSAQKNVLFELFTGTWCGWCPGGIVNLKEILKQKELVIPVAIHAGDTMEITSGTELADFVRPAYPQAMINRKLWPKEPGMAVSRGEGTWEGFVNKELYESTPVEVDISHSFNPESRKLIVTVNASFVDYALPGDFRIHLLVTEDNVSDDHPSFNQSNFFSKNDRFPDHPFYNEPNPIPGYKHNFLLRQAPSGAWGTPRIIADTPKPGESYQHTYAIKLPEYYDLNEVSLVGFVSYYGSDQAERFVLNAHQKKLLPASALKQEDQSDVGRLYEEATLLFKTRQSGGSFFRDAVGHLDTIEIDPIDYKKAGLLYLPVNRRTDATRYLEKFLAMYPGQGNAEVFAVLATNYGYANNVENAEHYYAKAVKSLYNRDQSLTLGHGRLIDAMDMALLFAYTSDTKYEKAVKKGEEIIQNLTSEQPAEFHGWTILFNYYPVALTKLNRHDEAIRFLEDQIAQHGPESGLGQWAIMYKILARYDQLLSQKGKAAAIEYIEERKNLINNAQVLKRLNTDISHLKLIGEKMPDLVIDDWLSEQQINLQELGGKVVVLDFWATWCGPCRASFPKMNAIYQQYKEQGLRMIGLTKPYGYTSSPQRGIIRDLSYEEEVFHTKKFVEEMNLVFPQIMDKEGINTRNFNVGYLPTVFVIDREGIIRRISFLVDEEMESLIRELLDSAL